jgi:diguanylate cyclase (GGDEF)-like protein/PAS domain S-box-containing protein
MRDEPGHDVRPAAADAAGDSWAARLERLERERDLLRTALDHMDQGLLVVARDMSVPVLSRRVAELLHLPADFVALRPSFPEILNHQFVTGTISFETLTSSINGYILNLEDLPEVHVYERATFDGRLLEVRTTRLPDGGFVRTFTDRTARLRRDEAIAQAQAEYRTLFENMVIGVYRAGPDMRPVQVNPALARMNGYADPDEMLAALAADPAPSWHVDPDRPAEFLRLLAAEGRVTDLVSEVRRHRTGERLWVAENAWAIREAAGALTGFEGTVADATERKRAEDRIAHMARHDALTGLPNRLRFAERLTAALGEAGGRLAVVLFDLDRFKAVNDTLGHPAGDALLRVLAGRVAALAGPDDIVARLGGDEFALVKRGADAAAAAALAEDVLTALRAPARVEGREIALGASIGIALAPGDGADATQLMKSADVALYRAKGEGRDGWRLFAPAMSAEVEERQRLEADLRAALERGEFALAYQPVTRVADGRPVGYEALLRWTHPERGPVPPEAFIGVAEETRLIGPLGAWVMARACGDAAAWPADTDLWVNVSAVQLARPEFEAELDAALSASGFPPRRLLIEITETSLMEGRAELGPLIARLRRRGLRTALDDFGTGYSSLGYLRRFAFDVIKIDRSFVADLAQPETAAIVMSVLDLARRLGIATVAEGVETEAQLAALRVAGCAFVQGHLFGPPVEAAAIGG